MRSGKVPRAKTEAENDQTDRKRRRITRRARYILKSRPGNESILAKEKSTWVKGGIGNHSSQTTEFI